MEEIYLDNCSTTPLFTEVMEAMYKAQLQYGNPSSLHFKGIQAEKYVEEARKIIAGALKASPEEIIFTSGGTEANNLAIKGLAYRHYRKGSHLITTPVEHPSALNTFQQLQQEGFSVSYMRIDQDGYIDLDYLKTMLSNNTTLVSFIHVNNETGTIQNIKNICRMVKDFNPNILVHADGVQALGKIPLRPGQYNLDALTISAHKIHGPKGTGALWIKNGVLLQPLFQGGNQENNLRPGTENVAGITGFGKAVSEYINSYAGKVANLHRFKHLFFQELKEKVEVYINGPELKQGAPHIINLSFPGIKSEVLIRSLEEQGIYSSPGSACHSRNNQPSHVLVSLGLNKERIDGAVRFSFSVLNTEEEIEYSAKQVAHCVKDLQKLVF